MEIQEINYNEIEEKRVNLEVFKKLSLEEISNLTDKEKEDYFDRCLNYIYNLDYDFEKNQKDRDNFKAAYYKVIPIFKAIYRPRVINSERLDNRLKKIYVCNCNFPFEQFLIISALGNEPISFLAPTDYIETSRYSAFEKAGCIFVDEKSKTNKENALLTLAKKLTHGENVLMFLNGFKDTNSKNISSLDYKSDAVILAQEIGAEIIPIGISGTMRAFKNDLTINIGQSFFVDPIDDVNELSIELLEVIDDLVCECNTYDEDNKEVNKQLKKRNRI